MVRKVVGGSVGPLVQACLHMMCDLEDEDDWAVSDEPQEEDNDSNAVVAESALDRLACGLGGKTVFPHILQLTPAMLQVSNIVIMDKSNMVTGFTTNKKDIAGLESVQY